MKRVNWARLREMGYAISSTVTNKTMLIYVFESLVLHTDTEKRGYHSSEHNVFRGTANSYGAQMLSHDFTEGLARELVFDLGGHRVYGMTFSNWILLMSLHKCARTIWFGTLRLHCLMWATERWRSRGLRGVRREEEEKRGKGGMRPFIRSRPTYLPKMDGHGVGLVALGLLDNMRHHPVF
ncbi:hypothetical protein N7516_001684 [Penicillium verrucosum]|uniref:uncharacterized protein n=1 Tax=Penicillium verrucosum TaxID=60171 RepID=UPI002545911E|nr:uncharacterized protein N7516_001684 [Penicillium verrucosum]KAJ5941516.1 hypothetical protein N7516_001684 [Penicillium verrucosum]